MAKLTQGNGAMKNRIFKSALIMVAMAAVSAQAMASPDRWQREWPKTDFSKSSVDFGDILSGGPPKDGIPSIDEPKFVPQRDAKLSPTEPVVGLTVNGESRAYPLQVLTWHEIVNDTIGGVPVTVTYCPLCNAAIVFERTLADGTVTEFGTTGKLRRSDLVMYDRQSESWWQQFSGEAIVGKRTGETLTMLPARLESYSNFQKSAPKGKVLVPNNSFFRDYGRNPYAGYDSAARPFLYNGEMPEGISPMARVVVVDGKAWSLALLRKKTKLEAEGFTLSWQAGQNSALDQSRIAEGRDVGTVSVKRNGKDSVHHVTFAFVYHAFHPDGKIYKE